MKKFNLEQALNGEKVITRNGREVIYLHLAKNITELYKFPLLVVIKGDQYSDKGLIEFWVDKDGQYNSHKVKSNLDLFMYEETIIRYANVYRNKEGNFMVDDTMYESLLEAKKSIKNKEEFIKTIKIEDK